MQWNDHWRIEGKHAYLGASKYHWIRYDMSKLRKHFENHKKAQEGDELHALAAVLIKKRIKQVRDGSTFRTYVNDAIGFRMDVEVPLFYTDDMFGTADAISFRDHILRIHDLKTGSFPGKMDQLKVYAVFFFLEYGKLLKIKPHDIEIILRLYQNDQIIQLIADPDEIVALMEHAKTCAAEVERMKEVMM